MTNIVFACCGFVHVHDVSYLSVCKVRYNCEDFGAGIPGMDK